MAIDQWKGPLELIAQNLFTILPHSGTHNIFPKHSRLSVQKNEQNYQSIDMYIDLVMVELPFVPPSVFPADLIGMLFVSTFEISDCNP